MIAPFAAAPREWARRHDRARRAATSPDGSPATCAAAPREPGAAPVSTP